jgi:hypothetical protein
MIGEKHRIEICPCLNYLEISGCQYGHQDIEFMTSTLTEIRLPDESK